MKIVNLIVKMKQQFYKLLVGASAVATIVIFVTMVGQIFMRRVLHRPMAWAEDLAVFLFIWITFLGAAMLFERKNMISVDTLVAVLPKKVQLICEVISNVILIVSLSYLLRLSWQFMLRQQSLGHNLGGALLVPSWVIMIPVIISVAAMAISSLASFISRATDRGDHR